MKLRNVVCVGAGALSLLFATQCSSQGQGANPGSDGGVEAGTPCGAAGQACCNGTACNNGLSCTAGTCAALPEEDAGSDAASGIGEAGSPSDASVAPDAIANDAATHDAALARPSCESGGAGMTSCGPTNDGSCCASSVVPGGPFYRGYDGISTGYTDKSFAAAVSPFRLDTYEVTVGRFRQFVNAVIGGWRPAPGSGKHAHLNGGSGVVSVGAGDGGSGFEDGWNSAWNGVFATSDGEWYTNLHGNCSGSPTWTQAPGANESLPVNCVNWYQAFGFCAWDGGFLPTEAEWNYAAAGGNEQRVYPWSAPPSSLAIDCTYANYDQTASVNCTPPTKAPNKVGSESPQGDGKWGQADLAGNVLEWTLDYDLDYPVPCTDCARLGFVNITQEPNRVFRGGAFTYGLALASWRPPSLSSDVSNLPFDQAGIRCAAAP